VNSFTLGRFCTARLGRADIDVANRAVATNAQARQLCYPQQEELLKEFIAAKHDILAIAQQGFHQIKEDLTNLEQALLFGIGQLNRFDENAVSEASKALFPHPMNLLVAGKPYPKKLSAKIQEIRATFNEFLEDSAGQVEACNTALEQLEGK